MTKQEQRAAIAKVMGWTEIFGRFQHLGLRPGDEDDGTENCLRVLPDYLNDLNAMHEAEKFLNHDQDLDYSESLEVVVQGKFNCNNGEDMRRLRSATASQRAEAFLRTLNLWTE